MPLFVGGSYLHQCWGRWLLVQAMLAEVWKRAILRPQAGPLSWNPRFLAAFAVAEVQPASAMAAPLPDKKLLRIASTCACRRAVSQCRAWSFRAKPCSLGLAAALEKPMTPSGGKWLSLIVHTRACLEEVCNASVASSRYLGKFGMLCLSIEADSLVSCSLLAR